MRNPFHQEPKVTQEQVDQVYADHGFATKIQRRVPRSHGEPLYFQCRMPTGIVCDDAADAIAAHGDLPAWLNDEEMALANAARVPGIVLVGMVHEDHKPDDIFCTLTVAFSEGIDNPDVDLPEGRAEEEIGPGWKSIRRVFHVSDRLTGINRMVAIPSTTGSGPLPMGIVTFLMRTTYGGLVMSYTSMHNGGGSDPAYNFYIEVAKSAQLEDHPPDDDIRD